MCQYIIDDVLEEMAIEDKTHFSPRLICQKSNINDLKFVTEYLLSLVKSKSRIKVNYEVECPNGDSDFAIKDPNELELELRECHICTIPYRPSLDRIWISFDFLPEYKEHVKKKGYYKKEPSPRQFAVM